jgi:hypothetical protein
MYISFKTRDTRLAVCTMEMGKRDESQVLQISTWAINEVCFADASLAATALSRRRLEPFNDHGLASPVRQPPVAIPFAETA